jgi:hypothetical protein
MFRRDGYSLCPINAAHLQLSPLLLSLWLENGNAKVSHGSGVMISLRAT